MKQSHQEAMALLKQIEIGQEEARKEASVSAAKFYF